MFNKRPAVLALAFTVVAAILAYIGNVSVIITAIAVFIIMLVLAALKNKPSVVVAVFMGVVVLLHTAVIQLVTINRLKDFDAKNVEICGIMCNEAFTGEAYITQTVKAYSINKTTFATPVRIRLVNSSGFALEQGDYVCITARLKASDGTAYKDANYAQGIYATGNNIKVKHTQKGDNIYSLSGRVKQYVTKTIEKFLPYDKASVLGAIVIGDKANVDTAFHNNVIDSGVSHMLVVSGMHLGIICSMVIRLLHKLMSKRAAAVVVLPLILFIALVCDFSYSIVRAGIAYIIYLISNIILKSNDSLSSLCMACAFIFMINPFALGSAALLLSASATFGIIVLSEPMLKRINGRFDACRKARPLKIIAEPTCVTLGATVLCLPASMLLFGRVSLISIATNILVSYSITIALCATIIGLALYLVIPFEPLLNIIFAVPGICLHYFTFIIKLMAKIPYSAVNITNEYAIFVTIFVVVLAGYAFYCKDNKKKLVKGLAVAVVPFIIATAYLNVSKATVTAVKLSGAQCVIIAYDDSAVVIGSGNNASQADKINKALSKQKISKIDALYILDDEGYAGAKTVLEANAVECVYTAQDQKTIAKLKEDCKKVFALPSKRHFDDGVTISTVGNAVYADVDGYTVFIGGSNEPTPTQNLYLKSANAIICTQDEVTSVQTKYTLNKTQLGNVALKIKQGYALTSK